MSDAALPEPTVTLTIAADQHLDCSTCGGPMAFAYYVLKVGSKPVASGSAWICPECAA